MKVKCICGNILHDENLQTCNVYGVFLEEEYLEFLESDIKSVEEFVDKMPMSAPFWQCVKCERLYFFKKGKIQIFNLEQEIFD